MKARNMPMRLGYVVLVMAVAIGCDRGATDFGEPAPSDDLIQQESELDAEPLFADLSTTVGMDQQHFSGTTGDFLFAEILGSGVALFDYDNDGDLDIYLVQGKLLDPEKQLSDCLFPPPEGQPDGNRLYRNELVPTGSMRFVDVTAQSGAGSVAYGMGVAVGDYDNDGDDDLYLTNLNDNQMLRNDGDGTFSDVTSESATNVATWSTSASFFDYDNDGDLDLYVVDYCGYSLETNQRCTSASGNLDYCGPQNYQSLQDHLFRNEGDGTFRDVSEEMSIAKVRGPGLGVACADFDGNGWTDVFVANDGEANFVWMNEGGEQFSEMGLMSGTAYNRDGSAEASMGVTAGDYDGDGDEDLFMTHLINETNTLYRNDGSGQFTDVTDGAGLGFGSRGMTGFGSAWFDYDNDGWLDLYIGNGDVKVEEMRADDSDYPFDQPNQLYKNLGEGKFIEIKAAGGPATQLSEISRGVAFGDLDNDGDTDFVVTNNSGVARLFANLNGSTNNWLQLRLVGEKSNRNAYGARVILFRDGLEPLWRRVHTDGSYLSASDPRVLFGLGASTEIGRVAVIWPSGRQEQWTDLEANQQFEIVEGTGKPWERAAE
jgi:hypothetical protein